MEAASCRLRSATDPTALQLLQELASDNIYVRTRALSIALGRVTILRKGAQDILTSGDAVFVLEDPGSPRRCGGQGDLLAGCLGVALHWSQKGKVELSSVCLPRREELFSSLPSEERDATRNILAAILAASTIKAASVLAFAEKGRSMTSPDVLAHIGPAFASLTGDQEVRR